MAVQMNININKITGASEQATESRNRNNLIRQIGSCERALRRLLKDISSISPLEKCGTWSTHSYNDYN